eukprot:4516384-Amphidinium_carterae.1
MLPLSAHSVAQAESFESCPCSVLVRESVSMAIPTKRQIHDRSTSDVFYRCELDGKGPSPGSRAGEGSRNIENREHKGDPLGAWLTCRPQGATRESNKRTKTSLSVLASIFDMVAELAIAERLIGFASLLASIVVTRA